MKVFSVHGWINECVEPVYVLKDGKRMQVEPMTGLEEMFFKQFGKMESVYTSGGASTLTKTFEGVIKELDYKTIRFPGHWNIMKILNDVGFLKLRDVSEPLLDKLVSYEGQDMMLARITMGVDLGAGRKKELEYELVDLHDDEIGHSSMQRTTGYSASIIAQMLLNGSIKKDGAIRQEIDVPAAQFVQEWRKRNIILKERRF